MKTIVSSMCSLSLLLLLFPGLKASKESMKAINHANYTMNLNAARYEIPFQLKNGWIVLQIKINDSESLSCVFDTGAQGESIGLDSAAVSQLNLKITDTMTMRNPFNSQSMSIPIASLSKVSFEGGLELHNINGRIRSSGPAQVVGVIGLQPFKDYLVTINYDKKTLILEKGELPKADNLKILDYKSMRGIPSLKILIGGNEYDAHFDTGNMRTKISVSKELADKFTFISSPIEKGEGRIGGQKIKLYGATIAETIQFGKFTFDKPEITYPLPIQIVNFGNEFLSQFNITFDQKNERLKIEKNSK